MKHQVVTSKTDVDLYRAIESLLDAGGDGAALTFKVSPFDQNESHGAMVVLQTVRHGQKLECSRLFLPIEGPCTTIGEMEHQVRAYDRNAAQHLGGKKQ